MPLSISIHLLCGPKLSMDARKNVKFISYAKDVFFLIANIKKITGGAYPAIGGLGGLAIWDQKKAPT